MDKKFFKTFASLVLTLFLILFSYDKITAQQILPTTHPPENEPATILHKGESLQIEYQNQTILKGKFKNKNAKTIFNEIVEIEDGAIQQVFKWTSRESPLLFSGIITASKESFPCEADRKHDALQIVRHSVGLSHSLLNRAVYDRYNDWALSIDNPVQVRIRPLASSENNNSYKIEISGREIIFRFRPLYYQKHRGLKFFKPWTYRVWKKSVAGWCSWFAYFQNITEENIKTAADILAETLLPYGLEYLQIDDGYQQSPAGLPDTWLTPNDKFPSGLEELSTYISTKGFKPGIWTYTSFHQRDFAEKNQQYFVLDENGNVAYGNWVGYVLDGSKSETINNIIQPIYRGFKKTGWQYFKVDALRHLRYEGYNSYSNYFKKQGIDRTAVYQKFVKSIRDQIGRGNFMLGCWGIRPELAGIIDGCRIGTDGFGYGGLAQYNSYNNVVWRNDPDHIELSEEEAYRSCMVTSLTGSLFMLTDKPERYQTPIAEPAKRSLPILFTLPGQIYDVDPSRSSLIHLVDSEISGSGPRLFDADQKSRCSLYLLEINKPFGNWILLGRTGGNFQSIKFSELGLSGSDEYFVFEFWTKRLIGSFCEQFCPGEINPKYNCQLFCIRERLPHPQLIATNRHISCGGFEIQQIEWKDNKLSGKSELVANDTYIIYLTEPVGFQFKNIFCENAKIIQNKKIGLLRSIHLKTNKNQTIKWHLEFEGRMSDRQHD